MLGTAKFKNIDEFEAWFANLDMSEGETMCESCLDGIQDRDIRNLVKDMLYPVFWVNQDISQISWRNKKQDLIVKTRKMAQYFIPATPTSVLLFLSRNNFSTSHQTKIILVSHRPPCGHS